MLVLFLIWKLGTMSILVIELQMECLKVFKLLKQRIQTLFRQHFFSWSEEYRYILELCKHKRDLPMIDNEQSNKILSKMKANVVDFW